MEPIDERLAKPQHYINSRAIDDLVCVDGFFDEAFNSIYTFERVNN